MGNKWLSLNVRVGLSVVHSLLLSGAVFLFFMPNLYGQDPVAAAVDSLKKASDQIDADPKVDAKKILSKEYNSIPSKTKAEKEVRFCYGLLRLKHDLTSSYEILKKLSSKHDDYEIGKAAIYAAFKEKGARIGFIQINSFFSKAELTKKKGGEQESKAALDFQLWTMSFVENIRESEECRSLLKPLVNSEPYKKLRDQHFGKIKNNLIDGDDIIKQAALEKRQRLEKQIVEAKAELEPKEAELTSLWNLAARSLEAANDRIGDWSWTIIRKVVYQYGRYDDVYYYIDPSSVVVSEPNVMTYFDWSLGFRNRVAFATNGDFHNDVLYILRIYETKKPVIQQRDAAISQLQIVSANMQKFLVDFTEKYAEAIPLDAELTAAVTNYRQKMAAYNQQFLSLAKRKKKKDKEDEKNLTELGQNLLLILPFSVEESLKQL